MELDHVFIRAAHGAPEAALLRDVGLLEGSGNRHPGQGTANRRFFFDNAFIELLWIDDVREAASDATRRTQLRERLDANTDASPFGVCLRPGAGEPTAPFPAWAYTPAYLPAGMRIDVATDTPLREPMWFFLERGAPPRGQPRAHPSGVRAITSVTITMVGTQGLSAAARAATRTGIVHLVEGDAHLMDIAFDHGTSGRRHDFRPGLPLLIRC